MTSFETLRAEWLHARAAVAETDSDALDNLPAAKVDKAAAAAVGRLRAAEWKLLQTPAVTFENIRDRAEIVQQMFADADKMGPPTDNRHRLMLSALVAEILDYPQTMRTIHETRQSWSHSPRIALS
jgi:hypothetical protein